MWALVCGPTVKMQCKLLSISAAFLIIGRSASFGLGFVGKLPQTSPKASIDRSISCRLAGLRPQHTSLRLDMADPNSGDSNQPQEEPSTTETAPSAEHTLSTESLGDVQGKKGFWSKIFGVQKMDKATLASLGTSVILSYGFVSNAFGCTAVSCAWYIASRRVRQNHV